MNRRHKQRLELRRRKVNSLLQHNGEKFLKHFLISGGGLPCAAYGGREDIMRNVSPDGRIYQAGTLSGNPLAMTAGIATLKILLEDNLTEKISAKTSKLIEGIKAAAQIAGIHKPRRVSRHR